MSTYSVYRNNLIHRFWNYQNQTFPDWEEYFERPFHSDGRPPVFHKETADYNVLINPNGSSQKLELLLNEIPQKERHRLFRSMASSQAIAQSILGNLKVYDRLHYLSEMTDDEDLPLIGDAVLSRDNFHMEYSIGYLNEPRSTNVDTFISGDYQVAIECKLLEREIGTCSRPLLRLKDSNFERDYCNGNYMYQRGRQERCSLTNIGVAYWKFVPVLFEWKADCNHLPCPLHNNYQLVRNILAACVRPGGSEEPEKGHVVLIYDERNPAFQEGGKGYQSYKNTRNALHDPRRLRKCSWQRITNHLRGNNEFSWLVEQLTLKYGL